MENKSKQSTENFIKDIRRRTRRVFSSEQKIMIVMEAQRGEHSVASIELHSNQMWKDLREFHSLVGVFEKSLE